MAEQKGKKKLGAGRHLSAIKRNRQSIRHRDHNRHWMSTLRTTIKKVRLAIEQKNLELATTTLKKAVSVINKTAQKKVIPAKRASRYTSRLSKAVNALS